MVDIDLPHYHQYHSFSGTKAFIISSFCMRQLRTGKVFNTYIKENNVSLSFKVEILSQGYIFKGRLWMIPVKLNHPHINSTGAMWNRLLSQEF